MVEIYFSHIIVFIILVLGIFVLKTIFSGAFDSYVTSPCGLLYDKYDVIWIPRVVRYLIYIFIYFFV